MPELTDRELLERYASRGDGPAFAELVARHSARVYAACRAVLGDAHEAEDAAQATFLVLARKARSLSPKTTLAGWLFLTARHAAGDALRRRTGQLRREREAAEMRVEQSGGRPVDWEELQPQLHEALAALPAAQREALLLQYAYGLSQEAAARELGCPEETLRTRVKTGLERLRERLGTRGETLPAAALGAALAAGFQAAAPATLAASIGTVCLGQAAASPTVLSLTKGVVKAMFWTKVKLAAAVIGTTLVVGVGGGTLALKLAAEEPVPVPVVKAQLGADGTVLKAESFWRCFLRWKTEMVAGEDGKLYPVQPGFSGKKIDKIVGGKLPPADWKNAGFDDSSWVRMAGPIPAGSRELALICMRGKFEVQDPGTVQELNLDMTYKGGVVVYVNGTEVTRGHMPEGEATLDAEALPFPKEAYLTPEGNILLNGFGHPQKYPERIAMHKRELKGVKIPGKVLRKGVNVLAVEWHRDPVQYVAYERKGWVGDTRATVWDDSTPVGQLRLSAAPGAAVVPNVARPAGFQVWNASVVEKVRASDYGDPWEKLAPVVLTGCRNGTFSGQVVVGSNQAIRELKAEAHNLEREGGGGTIAAKSVDVRYGLLDESHTPGNYQAFPSPIGAGPADATAATWFCGLDEAAPKEVPVNKTGGAIQTVWVAVRVPADAKPGTYRGSLTISAAGEKPVQAAVALQVADWALPDPGQFFSHVGIIQSPDSVAERYGVEPWSDAHWKLLDRTFAQLARVGADDLYVPVIAKTHFGNPHGMVRWIKKKDGGWDHDFSIVKKYVDLAVKHLGKIPVVCLYVWNVDTVDTAQVSPGNAVHNVYFTVRDPETGALSEETGPAWADPKCKDFWQPVIDGLRAILKEHGLEGSMMFGLCQSRQPEKATVEMFKTVAPDVKWAVHCHPACRDLYKVQTIGYGAYVWDQRGPNMSVVMATRGWKSGCGWKFEKGFIHTNWPREGLRIYHPLATFRTAIEPSLIGGGQGVGRLGADFWPVPGSDKKGATRIFNRYPMIFAEPMSDGLYELLKPGPQGPVPTAWLEMLIDGAQEVETRIFIEKALDDPAGRAKVGEELAKRCEQILSERVWWMLLCQQDGRLMPGTDSGLYQGTGWQERSAQLYAAAAEVAGKLGGR